MADNTLGSSRWATFRSRVDPRTRPLRPSGPVQAPQRSSIWSQLRPLLGDRRGALVALGIGSVLSGFAEAGVLAIVAEVATALVNRVTRVHLEVGPLHVEATVGALLVIAFVLAVVRIALQVLISFLPARMAAEVQGNLRRRMFEAFTNASWGMQSRDREGYLQEIMTSQIMQVSQGAFQATTLIPWLFTFAVLVVSALVLNIVAAAVVLTAAILLFFLLRPINGIGARHARSFSESQLSYAGAIGEANRVAEETQVFGVAAAQRNRIGKFIAVSQDLVLSYPVHRPPGSKRLSGLGLYRPRRGPCGSVRSWQRPCGIPGSGSPAARASRALRSADPGVLHCRSPDHPLRRAPGRGRATLCRQRSDQRPVSDVQGADADVRERVVCISARSTGAVRNQLRGLWKRSRRYHRSIRCRQVDTGSDIA